jgi:hypothetical protein
MAVAECAHSIGQDITMTLMKRAKDSVFALPKMKWSEQTSIPQLSSGKYLHSLKHSNSNALR